MDNNYIIEYFLKILLTETTKKITKINIINSFNRLTNKTIKNYLNKCVKQQSITKTLLHTDTPIPFEDIYQPLKMKHGLEEFTDKNIKKLFKHSNYITIIGNAGSGKSTLVKRIFQQSIKEQYKIPVIINFRSLKNNSNLVNIISKEFGAIDEDSDSISKYLKNGKFLIIIDGFDEKISYAKNSQAIKINNLMNFFFKYEKNSYIITSRPFSGAEHLPIFHNYRIKPFSAQDRLEFIKNQLKASKQLDIIVPLTKSIKNYSAKFISEFLETPLLLLLYIITYKYSSVIPQKRYIFYRRVINTLFIIHDSMSKPGYSRPLKSNLSQDSFEKILYRFAYKTYSKGITYFDYDYYCEIINAINKKGVYDINNRELLYDLLVNISLLIEDGEYYAFAHTSIQEYLCVMYLKYLPNDSIKKKAYNKLILQLSTRYFYEINNFIVLCQEIDDVNYYRFFYINSLRKVRSIVYDQLKILKFTGEKDQEKRLLAIFFIQNIIEDFYFPKDSYDSLRNTCYLLFNKKIGSTIFLLEKDFKSFRIFINKLYKYLSSEGFFCLYNKLKNKSKANIIELIISHRKDYIKIINQMLIEITLRIYEVESNINSLIDEDDEIVSD